MEKLSPNVNTSEGFVLKLVSLSVDPVFTEDAIKQEKTRTGAIK